mmetsp:Transcript_7342/g.18793  ORF Transcript_7342/g.18793 Transcript_7342/m.18793 type:complete len:126 (+) Transcript_7342:83-460(+)
MDDALSAKHMRALAYDTAILEARMVSLLGFRLHISPALFFNYYFALRDLGMRSLRAVATGSKNGETRCTAGHYAHSQCARGHSAASHAAGAPCHPDRDAAKSSHGWDCAQPDGFHDDIFADDQWC